MQASQSQRLKEDEPRRIDAGELRVEAGVIWLTERGNASDIFLRRGQRYLARPGRRAIIQAMSADARISYTPPERPTDTLRSAPRRLA